MSQEKSIVKRLFTLITYQKPKNIKRFYIPEVNEKGIKAESQDNNIKSKTKNQKDVHSSRNIGIKEPIPAKEINKEKKGDDSKASENEISKYLKSNMDFLN